MAAQPLVAVLRLLAPSSSFLDRALADARTAEFSYAAVGATRTAELPDGYRVDRYERSLGAADGCFEGAVDTLRRWQAHAGSGLRIHPAGAVAGPASRSVRRPDTRPRAVLPCRVVYMAESESWFTFAYGTLPGHLERGEVR